VAIGDLNGDGDPDLASANFGSDSVSVLLNEGDGTFGGNVEYGVGRGVVSVAIGDLDLRRWDGGPDLAAANFFDNNVSVLLNAGGGTFAAAVTYDVDLGPWSVTIADLNNDGHSDLAVANSGDLFFPVETVSVLLGRGDGTFAGHVTFLVGLAPLSVAAGDLDGDGDLDLATANFLDDTVSVLLNDGDGVFLDEVPYAVGLAPTYVAMGDLDLDGDLDLCVTNVGTLPNPGRTISVLLNEGGGTFGEQVIYDVGVEPMSLSMGDLDGDGYLDLAVGNIGGDNVSVLLNSGNGTFVDDGIYGTGADPSSTAVADLDGDGDIEVATANSAGHSVSVLFNRRIRQPEKLEIRNTRETRNPKLEIRNKSKMRNTKHETKSRFPPVLFGSFGFCSFGFVSDFGFRISRLSSVRISSFSGCARSFSHLACQWGRRAVKWGPRRSGVAGRCGHQGR
jgi:hypothetical protein